MTPHDHRKFVPGCYRCEMGKDEMTDGGGDCPHCDGDGWSVDADPVPCIHCEAGAEVALGVAHEAAKR